jgi:hypothetical protein
MADDSLRFVTLLEDPAHLSSLTSKKMWCGRSLNATARVRVGVQIDRRRWIAMYGRAQRGAVDLGGLP